MNSLTKVIIATVMMGVSVPALAQDRDNRRSGERDSSMHQERDRNRNDGRTEGDGPAGWLSREDVTSKLAANGFKPERIKAEGRGFEVYATDASGARVKLHVDPKSGEIIRRERDDRR